MKGTMALLTALIMLFVLFGCGGGGGSGSGGTTPTGYKISGKIADSAGNGASGVPVVFQGGYATTDTNGNYSFNITSNGTYTFWPNHDLDIYSPTKRSVTATNADVTGQDFIWQWSTAVIAGFGQQQYSPPALAVDSNNKVHVAYLDSGQQILIYTNNTLGSWPTSTIPGSIVYTSPALAVDSSKKAHIVYDAYGAGLQYVTNATGTWVTASVGSSHAYVYDVSMAIDSNNKLHIFHGNYVTNTTGSWMETVFDSNAYVTADIAPGSIAVDSNNAAHICYEGLQKELKYATNALGSWATITISTQQTGHCSIAVDKNNKIHIASGSSAGVVYYSTDTTGSWVTAAINSDNDAFNPYIAIDSNNKAHIVASGVISSHYYTNASGTWAAFAGPYNPGPLSIDSNNKLYAGTIYNGGGAGHSPFEFLYYYSK